MANDFGDISSNLRRLEGQGIPIKLSTRNGLLGRQCSSCQGYFEIETTHDLPTMHCPYCGASNTQDHFWTQGQREQALATTAHEANKAIAQALGQQPTVAAPSGGNVPAGEATSQELQCGPCQFRFGVNGTAVHCPRCGASPT